MTTASNPPSALELLWAKLAQKGDLPALSRTVQVVIQLADSEQAKVDALASVILRDPALSSRVLRLANSAAYRRSNAGEVTTISRALVVLGFDTVRNLALTTAVFDRLGDREGEMAVVLARALFSALLAEAMASHWQMPRETLFLATLFRHLGVLLVEHHLPEESAKIAMLAAAGLPRSKAEQQVLGVSCAALGIFVAKEWGLPPSVISGMEHPSGSAPHELSPKSDAAFVWLASAAEAVGVQVAETGKTLAVLTQEMSERYPFFRQMSATQWRAVRERSEGAMRQWWQTLVGEALPNAFATALGEKAAAPSLPSAGIAGGQRPGDLSAKHEGEEQRVDPALPFDPQKALARLATGLEELTQTLLEGQPWAMVGYLACEVVWRALRCERVIMFARQQRLLQPAVGIAPEWEAMKKRGWVISLEGPADVCQLAIYRGVDIEIEDRNAPSLTGKIPEPIRRLPRGASALLLPLRAAAQEPALGLLYCDKPLPLQLRLPLPLKAQLRQWRNLVTLAWRNRLSGSIRQN